MTSLLSSFSCQMDADIETFLHNRAIEFELLSKARTYLVCDEDILRQERKLCILGYFSLSLKTLRFPEGISNRKRKELDGFSAKIHGEPITEVPCYLIGQLAKNSSYVSENLWISGVQLIDFAVSVVDTAVNAVGGRYVLVECHENQKLLDFYKQNGFKIISYVEYNGMPMVQLTRKLVTD